MLFVVKNSTLSPVQSILENWLFWSYCTVDSSLDFQLLPTLQCLPILQLQKCACIWIVDTVLLPDSSQLFWKVCKVSFKPNSCLAFTKKDVNCLTDSKKKLDLEFSSSPAVWQTIAMINAALYQQLQRYFLLGMLIMSGSSRKFKNLPHPSTSEKPTCITKPNSFISGMGKEVIQVDRKIISDVC